MNFKSPQIWDVLPKGSVITSLLHKTLTEKKKKKMKQKRNKKVLVWRDMIWSWGYYRRSQMVRRAKRHCGINLRDSRCRTAAFSYLWTESTSWPHWWFLRQRSRHSSIPCASSCERKSRSLPTVSAHKSTHAPEMHIRRQRSRWCDIWMVGILNIYAPSGIFYHRLWRSKWSSLESVDLSTCRRDN